MSKLTKEVYQRIGGESQEISSPESIKNKKTDLYNLINQLSTERAKNIAAGMALKKGLINGTEPEFQAYLKDVLLWKDLPNDIELMRRVQGNIALMFYHPYSDMYLDPKLSEDQRKNLYEGAKKAWEEAGQFILARTLAEKNGDKERYKLYDNLAMLLEDSKK